MKTLFCNKQFFSRMWLGLFLFSISVLNGSASYGYNKYFLPSNKGAQFENVNGTSYLVFDYPGKSAKELYQRALEIFRNSTAKEERVENRSIVFYEDNFIPSMNASTYCYKYSVMFRDGKIRIDNPYLVIKMIIHNETGYPDAYKYISILENAREGAKEKNKAEYDNWIKIVKDELSSATAYFDAITDNLVQGLKPDILDNPSSWVLYEGDVKFKLTPNGLTNENNQDYVAIALPGKNMENIKARIRSLINILTVTGDYERYFCKEMVTPDIKDIIRLTYPVPCDFMVDISTRVNVGPYQSFYFVSNGIIRVPNSKPGNLAFILNIVYADEKIKISNPVITHISQDAPWGYEMLVGYKYPGGKSGIFNAKDDSILYPDHKKAIEEHFENLFALIKKYLISEDFENIWH